MTSRFLIPALVSATMVVGVGAAQAGTVFDFIPRMDFAPQPELVKQDKTQIQYVCDPAKPDASACAVKTKDTSSNLATDIKK